MLQYSSIIRLIRCKVFHLNVLRHLKEKMEERTKNKKHDVKVWNSYTKPVRTKCENLCIRFMDHRPIITSGAANILHPRLHNLWINPRSIIHAHKTGEKTSRLFKIIIGDLV